MLDFSLKANNNLFNKNPQILANVSPTTVEAMLRSEVKLCKSMNYYRFQQRDAFILRLFFGGIVQLDKIGFFDDIKGCHFI